METNFTQGEWKMVDYGHALAVETILLNGQAHTICTDQFCYAAKFDGSAVANAKLIAAAPDMYVALLAAQTRLQSLQTYFTAQNFIDRYGDADENTGCLLVIHDAIKKATS
jgi:hypothetical protein